MLSFHFKPLFAKGRWTEYLCPFPTLLHSYISTQSLLGTDENDHCLLLLAVYELHESSWGLGGWLDGTSASLQGEETNINFPSTAFPSCSGELNHDPLSQSCPETSPPSEEGRKSLCGHQFWKICNIFHFL